ncbi:MAG: carboxypeptidase-like regulatory domain-containing protein [Ginsengibacter sp.]
MKRIQYALFLFAITVLSFNCQKQYSGTGSGTTTIENNLPSPIIATLQGNIKDETGQPAAGVQIKAGSKTATTDASGYFRIIKADLDKNASVVSAEKPGYFKGLRTFNATSGVNQVVIKLLKKTMAGSIDAGTGGNVTLSNGAQVTLRANGVIKENDGSVYTGSINVYATYIDPSASDIRETIPGSLMGNDKDNKRVSLVSFGMMAVTLESASGEKLQIASGSSATLTSPIPLSVQSIAPATISLWYVDEQTGLWKEEGMATKTGTDYVGQVKHFSFWNSDFSAPSVTLSLTIKNGKGLPVVYASVMITSADSGHAYSNTDSLGQVRGLVPSNENLVLKVIDQCGTPIYSKNIGPFDQNTNLGDIVIESTTSSIVTLQGKLLDCNNAPVTNGYAIIYIGNIQRYANTDASGNYATTAVICSGSATTCMILGIDDGNTQQGLITNVSISSPVTDAGNISACGTSAAEFVNYNLDGTAYELSKPGTDSLFAFSTQGPAQSFTTSIMGYKLTDGINFSFIDNGATGIFAISNLFIMGMNNTGLVQPFNVTVTSYPQSSGEFYEGTFSGQFRDSADLTSLHTIKGSFRVRKY